MNRVVRAYFRTTVFKKKAKAKMTFEDEKNEQIKKHG